MTITATLLVVLSASMHAGWNLFSKNRSPTIGFFQLSTLGTILWFSPVLLMTADLVSKIPLQLWGLLLIAGLFQAIYYVGLAGAYARGALSIAYPLARSIPLLLIVAFTFATGRGSDLSFTAIFGIIAIVAGAFILPMNHFKDLNTANYLNPSCMFAVIAAVGTAGYSIVDDLGMNILQGVSADAADWMRALFYLVTECIFTALWLQVILLFTKRSARHFYANWRNLVKPALLTGLAIGGTYSIILLAMTHAVNVSYVVGLRQLSIPIGALLGIFILKEKSSLLRYVGLSILFTGLVLVAIG